MKAYLKKEWLKDPKLKHWNGRPCVYHKCTCDNPNLVELWEQDSCYRGRIDTIVCVECDKVKSFNIIR